MAKLMICGICKGKFSSDALTCPHCGEVKKTQKKSSTGSGFLLLVIIGILAAVAIPKLDTPTQTYTAKPKEHLPKVQAPTKTPEQTHKEAIKNSKTILNNTIKQLQSFNKIKSYKNITVEKLGERLKHMRNLGKNVFFQKDAALSDKELKKLWQKAKKLQIKTQIKHYPLMRDALGPLLRQLMWEHNMHIVTTGKGYTRIILTAGGFASNAFIKKIHNTMGITYSDYRFKRADYKWFKGATEWEYFTLDTKKDNEL